MKDGSCAMRGREPCQVGNQAALSGLPCVPQGCLSGAEGAVTVRKDIFDKRVYGSIRHIEVKKARGRRTQVGCRGLFFFNKSFAIF